MERCEDLVQILSPFFDSMRKMEMKLKCPVCNNLLEEPKLLPCDHIICKNCLPTVDDGKQPSCPKCKKFRPKDARGSQYVEEMMKIFNEMDGAISDVFNQIISGKASVCEEAETKEKPTVYNEGSYVPVTSASCKNYEADEVVIVGSVTSNMCNDGQIDPRGTTHSNVCASDLSPTSSCEIIEIKTVASTPKGSFKKEEAKSGEESENHSAGATKSAKKREGRSTVGDGKRLRKYDIGDLDFQINKQEIKFRSTPINLFDDECAFCHSFRITELYGPIVCYLNGILVEPEEAEKGNIIYVHEKCLEWAPKIYFSGDTVMNLEEEIERGEKLICSKCGVKGAVLGCFYGPCRRSYHATCALEIDCSWDSANFQMLCPTHASEKVPGFVFDA